MNEERKEILKKIQLKKKKLYLEKLLSILTPLMIHTSFFDPYTYI